MNAPETHLLTMTRHLRAPASKVYAAFTSAAGLGAWLGPRGMQLRNVHCEARLGGAWGAEMVSREGTLFAVGGTFTHLEPHSRVAYTWCWLGDHSPLAGMETHIDVRLVEHQGETDMTMVHSGFVSAALRDNHHAGWTSTFNRLSDAVDPQGTAGTLQLLGDARSSYTRTARMAFAEKGIAYTLQNHAPNTPEILAVHAFGKIPALRDGPIEIFETQAILVYLDEAFDQGQRLTPGTIIGRTRCAQWISATNAYFYDTMVRRYLLQILFPRGAGGQPDRAVMDSALAEMPRQFAALEKAYATSDWLAGEFSMADLFLAPIIAYLQHMPESSVLLRQHPNVLRAAQAVQARPSFAATAP